MTLSIRRMENEDIERIRDIDRSEVIRVGYRQDGGEIVAVDVNWEDNGWVEGDGEHSFVQMIRGARRQLDLGGTAIGTFDGDRLVGIAIYRPRLTPSMGQLALLHVSNGYRRLGIATRLYGEGSPDGARGRSDTPLRPRHTDRIRRRVLHEQEIRPHRQPSSGAPRRGAGRRSHGAQTPVRAASLRE